VVFVVEGGVDALALRDLYMLGDLPPPTVVVSGGVGGWSWIDERADILAKAAAVYVAQENERDDETQQRRDAQHELQAETLRGITAAKIKTWKPPVGVKDVAVLLEQELQRLEREQDEEEVLRQLL
jgi:hypothetical protein